MVVYKDLINFSIVRKLKEKLNNVCIIYNNLVNKSNIKKRESDFYEVYTKQYQEDLSNLEQLRDTCLHTADLCNEILLMANRHHIKQYYIDKEVLDDYEFKDEYFKEQELYNKQQEEKQNNKSQEVQEINPEEDFW